MRLYLAGRMTGVKHHNLPLFDATARMLRNHGYEVVSPAEMADPMFREAVMSSDRPLSPSELEEMTGKTWGELLARDVQIVADDVDGLVVLPGWQKSRGACLETFAAALCGKPVFYVTLRRVPRSSLVAAWTNRSLL